MRRARKVARLVAVALRARLTSNVGSSGNSSSWRHHESINALAGYQKKRPESAAYEDQLCGRQMLESSNHGSKPAWEVMPAMERVILRVLCQRTAKHSAHPLATYAHRLPKGGSFAGTVSHAVSQSMARISLILLILPVVAVVAQKPEAVDIT
jgi:hypothetical protein